MKEADLQSLIIQTARSHGVLVYHTHDSRRSQPGFPDLVLVGRAGVLYRELKTTTGRLTEDQEHWLASLASAGEDACTWRPEDWPRRIVNEIRALGKVIVERTPPSQEAVRRHLAGGRAGTRKVPLTDIVPPESN